MSLPAGDFLTINNHNCISWSLYPIILMLSCLVNNSNPLVGKRLGICTVWLKKRETTHQTVYHIITVATIFHHSPLNFFNSVYFLNHLYSTLYFYASIVTLTILILHSYTFYITILIQCTLYGCMLFIIIIVEFLMGKNTAGFRGD